jgi:isoleucyl-tRNA synthetase
MAPILSFLAEETYGYLTDKKHDSVFLEKFPEPVAAWHKPELEKLFDTLLVIRSDVQKKLEELRAPKIIGSSQEAQVTITADGDNMIALEKLNASHEKCNVREFLIVSAVTLKKGSYGVMTEKASGEKCVRCWVYSNEISTADKTLGVCQKCVEALT